MPPKGWRDGLGVLAMAFHWGPEDLLGLSLREVDAWLVQVERLHPKPRK